MKKERKAGQAIVEYLVVAGILLATLAILSLFFSTFGEYGERILNLGASEYP